MLRVVMGKEEVVTKKRQCYSPRGSRKGRKPGGSVERGRADGRTAGVHPIKTESHL